MLIESSKQQPSDCDLDLPLHLSLSGIPCRNAFTTPRNQTESLWVSKHKKFKATVLFAERIPFALEFRFALRLFAQHENKNI